MIFNKYNISKNIIENLSSDEILLLLKSISDTYAFYDSAKNNRQRYRFMFGGLFNPMRQCIEIMAYDPNKNSWICVNYVDEYRMPDFYACYVNIQREKQINNILQ
jgi:hypothetical protein